MCELACGEYITRIETNRVNTFFNILSAIAGINNHSYQLKRAVAILVRKEIRESYSFMKGTNCCILPGAMECIMICLNYILIIVKI